MINNYESVAAYDDWQNVLCTPDYLLHSINVKAGVFEFLSTSKERLSDLSFLDGRGGLTEASKVIELPIDEVLTWHSNQAINPRRMKNGHNEINRFIFHMSFCGSTLMARTLQSPGQAFCYKEPQIMLQLAEIKSHENILYRDRSQWTSLLSFVLSQLRLQWQEGEANIIKPSNWMNSMLPELLFDGGESRAILLSISREAFLTSIFRGGGERVQFMYSVLRHLLTAFPEYTKLVSEVEENSQHTIELFSRLALITHAIQSKAFARISELMPENSVHQCSYEQLVEDPLQQLQYASQTLRLELKQDDLSLAIKQKFSKHSKINYREFDEIENQRINSNVENVYADDFCRALDWADRNLSLAQFI